MSSERLSRLCFTPHATPLRKMLRLFHSHEKLRHCFTWTLLVGKMRFWKSEPTLSWSQELMDSSGTYSQRNPNTRKHVNVLPPWLHYLAPLIHEYRSTILMIIWKCAWGWLSADTVRTMHPWLIPCQSKSSEEGNIVVLWNMGSCSYVRYTNIYCTYKELSIWHFINSSQAENVCAPLLQIHRAGLNKRSNVNAGQQFSIYDQDAEKIPLHFSHS